MNTQTRTDRERTLDTATTICAEAMGGNFHPVVRLIEQRDELLEKLDYPHEEIAALLAQRDELLAACELIAGKMYDDTVGRTAVEAARAAITNARKDGES